MPGDFNEISEPGRRPVRGAPQVCGSGPDGYPAYPVPPERKRPACDFCGGGSLHPPHGLSNVHVGMELWNACQSCEQQWVNDTRRLGQGKRRLHGLEPKVMLGTRGKA